MSPDTAAWTGIAVMAALLVVQGVLAARFKGIISLYLGTQVLYWALAFVAMPAYLMIYQPSSDLELGDYRMLFSGYAEGVNRVIWLAVFGQLIYLATLAIGLPIVRRYRARRTYVITNDAMTSIGFVTTATIFWLIGWVARVGDIGGFSGLMSALGLFGSIGACLLIVGLPSKKNSAVPVSVAIVVVLEIIWSFFDASKTSLIVPLLALTTRWVVLGHKGLVRRILVLGVVALVGFLSIQPLKGIDTADRVSGLHSGSGPYAQVQGVLVSVLQRFDGAIAVTDAVYFGPGHWLSPQQAVGRFLTYSLPQGPFKGDVALGERWTREVRAATIPNQFADVSLAAGPTAEGWALAGYGGVIGENIFLGAALLLLCLAFESRRPLLMIFSAGYLFSTVLFEQGIFGIGQRTNKALQILVVGLILLVVLRERGKDIRGRVKNGRQGKAPALPPALPPIPKETAR